MTKDVTTNEDIDNYFFVGSQKFKAKLLEEYPELSQAELGSMYSNQNEFGYKNDFRLFKNI